LDYFTVFIGRKDGIALPKISVILPIYGVEAYLERCIDLLVRQTYSDFQLILVDDASPDRCGEICDEWVKKDSRIEVYHKENGGLSDARNFGIEKAKGEYLSFIDPDDYVTTDYLEYLLHLIESRPGCKLSACNHTVKRGEREVNNGNFSGVRVFSQKEAFREVLYHGLVDVSAWAKLYHRSLFETVRFPKGKWYEDTYIFGDILRSVDELVYGGDSKYFYVQRKNSFCAGNFRKERLSFIEAVDRLCEAALLSDPDLKRATLRRKNHALLSTLRYMEHCENEYRPLRDDFRRRVLEYSKEVLSDPLLPKRDRLAIQTLKMGFPIFFFAWRLYGRLR